MKILAADSSSVSAAAAVCEDEKIIAEGFINNGLTHSQTLLPLIKSTMSCSGTKYDDIDLFSVTTGPGSFTGVRIGVSTVKGLAFAANKPCVSVSSLEAIARTVASFCGIICAVMDARRNQVYNALFKSSGSQESFERLCEDRALAIEELLEQLYRDYPDKPIYLVGDGTALTASFDEKGLLISVPESLRFPRGFAIAAAALECYRRGEILSSESLNPVYLRASQAERELHGGA